MSVKIPANLEWLHGPAEGAPYCRFHWDSPPVSVVLEIPVSHGCQPRVNPEDTRVGAALSGPVRPWPRPVTGRTGREPGAWQQPQDSHGRAVLEAALLRGRAGEPSLRERGRATAVRGGLAALAHGHARPRHGQHAASLRVITDDCRIPE